VNLCGIIIRTPYLNLYFSEVQVFALFGCANFTKELYFSPNPIHHHLDPPPSRGRKKGSLMLAKKGLP